MIDATISLDQARKKLWDVVVVGAGLAGSVAAIGIAHRGRSVLLVDRKSFPRDKICGACLNADAVAGLKHLGVERRLNELRGIPLNSYLLASGSQRLKLDLPEGLSVTRRSLDAMLIEEAILAGAEFLPEVNLKIVDESHMENPIEPYRQLIDGHDSAPICGRVVIMATGLASDMKIDNPELDVVKTADSRIGIGTIANEFPNEYEPGIIYMAVAKTGYVGLTRTENNGLNIAAAVDRDAARETSPKQVCERVLEEAGFAISDRMFCGKWRGTAALTRGRKAVGSRRLLFVGDAIGYVEPFTGEGMAWAIRGGRAVSPLAAEAASDWNNNVIAQWTSATNDLVRDQQLWCRAFARVLRYPTVVSGLLRIVSTFPSLGRKVAKQINQEREHEVFDRRTGDSPTA